MQNVDQYRFSSFPQLPSELRTQFGGYPNVGYPTTIAVDAFGQPYLRHSTPTLEDQGPFQCALGPMPTQQLPTPPSSPGPYANYASQQPLQSFDFNSTRWSSRYLPGDRLQFQKVLGSGAYGVVHLAKDVSTGIQYAVKALNKFMPNGSPLDQRQQQFQQTEMRLHYQVSDHPNIVSLLRIKDSPEHTYVIMDYCPEGDLFSNITEKGRYVGDDSAARDIFLQILDAVAYCHSRGVYHRDLKPENILVTQGGNQVKLADFGLATTEAYATEFGCGSTFYMSPECQDQSSGMQYYACAPNDIWSLGVILVNLTCGRNPWKSASPKDSTFRAYMEDRQFLKSILPLSEELNAILGMIFEMDPTRRIKLHELRQRIVNCSQFTRSAQVDTQIYEYESYDEPLSPTSTISDEGTMLSSGSDNSSTSSASEVSDNDSQLDIEIMDEDSLRDSEFHDVSADLKGFPQPKTWIADSSVPVQTDPQAPQNQYVNDITPLVADSSIYQDSHLISSYVSPELLKPLVHTQTKEHRPSHAAWTSPTSVDDGRTAARAPARYVTQSQWGPINRWQSALNHSITPRITIHG